MISRKADTAAETSKIKSACVQTGAVTLATLRAPAITLTCCFIKAEHLPGISCHGCPHLVPTGLQYVVLPADTHVTQAMKGYIIRHLAGIRRSLLFSVALLLFSAMKELVAR